MIASRGNFETYMEELTMISMEVHRDVPQYIAIPWLITWVIALTVSTKTAQQSN